MINPEHIAKLFHETYERLAPQYGYETRPESAVPWEEAPEKNKRLMTAVCWEVFSGVCREVEELRKENEATALPPSEGGDKADSRKDD